MVLVSMLIEPISWSWSYDSIDHHVVLVGQFSVKVVISFGHLFIPYVNSTTLHLTSLMVSGTTSILYPTSNHQYHPVYNNKPFRGGGFISQEPSRTSIPP